MVETVTEHAFADIRLWQLFDSIDFIFIVADLLIIQNLCFSLPLFPAWPYLQITLRTE
jgi:hypothetical protein